MESSSKTGVNILLIVAIIFISLSIVSTRMKPKATPTPQPSVKTATTTPVVSITINDTQSAATTSSATTTMSNASTPGETSTTSPSLIIGKKWLWVATMVKSNAPIVPKKQDVFSLTFNQNGTIAGTTDCNKLMGGYKIATGTVSFSPLASTKMFCKDSQETEFSNALSGIKKYIIDKNNNLILTDGTSTIIFK